MVTIVRESNDPYQVSLGTAPLADVAVRAKPMPDAMISEDGNFPSDAFFEYARPLVGELPEYAELRFAARRVTEGEGRP
jgi:6-phosphofructokinase 1